MAYSGNNNNLVAKQYLPSQNSRRKMIEDSGLHESSLLSKNDGYVIWFQRG